MTIREYTTYNKYELPYYDIPGWHQYIDRNFEAIDGTFYLLTGTTNIRGIWKNNTVYNPGDRVIDNIINTVFSCLIGHFSPPTGTFADARSNNPTFWGAVQLFPTSVPAGPVTFNDTTAASDVLTGSVMFRGGIAVAKNMYLGDYLSVASANAAGLAVGRLGRTVPGYTPAFSVDCSDPLGVTGIVVKGKAAGNGAGISVQSTVANETLHINAKGTGAVVIGDFSSGPVEALTPLLVSNTVSIATHSQLALSVANDVGYPTLRVDTSLVAAPVTGLMLAGSNAGSGIYLNALSPGANENIFIDAKGTGRIVLSATAFEVWNTTASTAYTNGALICRGGAGIFLNLNVGGTITTLGDISMGVGTKIAINTEQVVGARVKGWFTPSSTYDRSAFIPSGVTLVELANRVSAIIMDLRAHGLIGT